MAVKGEQDVEMKDATNQEALQILANRSLVFQQNEAFEPSENNKNVGNQA